VLGDSNRLTAGLTAERDQTRNDGFGDINTRRASSRFLRRTNGRRDNRVFLTGGLRSDDHDTFRADDHRTAHGGMAAGVRDGSSSAAATAPDSVRPSFLDLYGQSSVLRRESPICSPSMRAAGMPESIITFLNIAAP
jgi:hypothetical protein